MAKCPLYLAVIMHNGLAVRLLLVKDSVDPTIQDLDVYTLLSYVKRFRIWELHG